MNLARVATTLPYSDAYALNDIVDMVRQGRLSVWENEHATVLTEVIGYPRKKALNYFLFAGDLKNGLKELQPKIIAHARECGCDRLRGEGRYAWGRQMRREGWWANAVVYKDII